ncbi:MAG: hypothetical protein K8S24_11250, partial [Candidatus Aegiribacteria sp.]|nr:hypothetical protein [Candidatus Aegiribacteria sp.]
MITVLASLIIAYATVPTGPTGLNMEETAVSPLEILPASFETVSTVRGNKGDKVLIVVADYLADPLEAPLAQFQSDIASEGWTVEMHVMSGGTAEDIKLLFQDTPDLDGAVLVGFLPCAWYEEDNWGFEEFPCELFLMDLDGTWTDSDLDGLYDGHSGAVAPEIWLGRIDAHTAYGPELLLLAGYFARNHIYRTGSLGLNPEALAFNDDDWSHYTDCGLDGIYGSSSVTVVNSDIQTTAENYLINLEQGYEFVHLMSHSCPWGHTFKLPSGMAGTVMAPEIAQVNPRTAFLQLFSCSNARWVEEGCLGNWYLFGTDYGLLVTGSAKTGSMLDFEEYYGPLAAGLTFGEAFREWWEYEALGGFSSSERAWFYGNALLGDPTLKPLTGSMDIGSHTVMGQRFTEYEQVSTSGFSDCFPSAASNSGAPRRTVAAWLSGENGRLDIAARLYEDGSGWGPVIYVDSDEYWDVGVSACYHDTAPWIVWSDFELSTYSYRIKTAHGDDFSHIEIQVDQEGYQISPCLASTGTRLWLTWLDWDATGGAVMLKSIDGAFPAAQISSIGVWCQNPELIVDDSGTIHLVWEERSPSSSRIMWCCGDLSGFSSPVEVSSGELCHSPGLDTDCSTSETCLLWLDEAGAASIKLRIWEGTGWGTEETVHTTIERISGAFLSRLPEPLGTGVIWQEGCGAAASIMGYPLCGPEPLELFPFAGPAWSPVSTPHELFWAGNEGDG